MIGPGEATRGELAAAGEAGRAAAEAGAVVVTGGLGGVMEAASRGAAEASGVALGILPGADRSGGNAHLTVAVPTGLGEARNALVVRAADGLVAIGGGWGTLSEIALARKAGKPVVAVGGWDLDGVDRFDSAAEAVAEVLRRLG